ncbi:MAG TPA: diguanylate cyclase, partial [Phycisphaerae bacterium]|nr:diguanylate cyclase [Phycisphaerae bacterium]
KVYLWSLGLAFGAVAVLATVSGVREAQRLTQLLRQEQRLYAQAASSQVEAGYHEEIWPFELLATIAENENFVSWHIVDGAGHVILSDCPLEESDDQHSAAVMGRVSSDLHEPLLAADEGPGVETWVVPMRMRTGNVPWTFRLSFHRETVRREIYAELRSNLLLTLVLAVILVPVALVVTRRMLAPLHSLTVAADALKTGALDVSLPPPTRDEIGQLVAAFDAMVRSIKVRDAEIRKKVRALADARDKLEERVRERTADLSKANENLKREIAERQRAEEAIRRSEQRFQEVARTAEEWIWEVDAQGLYTYSSRAVEDILGYTSEEVVGRKYFYDFCPPEDCEGMKRAAFEVFGRKEVFRGFPNRAVHKNGKPIWLMTTAAPILDAGGNLLGYRGTDMDVTERRAAEEDLRQANVRLRESQEATANEAMQRRILVEQSRDGIVVLDQNGKVYEANRSYAEMLGYSPEEVRQLHVWDWDNQWTPEQLVEMLRQVDEKGEHFETQHRRKDGTIIDVEVSTNGAVMAGQKLVFCVCRDVTDRKRAEEALRQANSKLEELATTDELTGLANRRRFMEILQTEIQRAKRHELPLALVMLDVDGFKAINDTHGHVFGDRVLVEFAKTLRGGARACDTTARYGGDEFMILMPETRVEEAVGAVERVRKAFSQRTISDGRRSLQVTVSAGVSGRQTDGVTTADGLVRLADEALYAAKHAGRDRTLTWNQIRHDQAPDALVATDQVETLRCEVAKVSLQSKEAFVESLWSLARTLEARDSCTKGHSGNVTGYAVAIAETLRLEPEEIAVVRRAAMVHDIGKVGVPDSILRKRGSLADHERRVIQRHVLISIEILDEMRLLEREVPLVRHHHERWDGKGYPDGISGNAIPRGARILAVADAFDAITSDRVYRAARSLPEAMQILIEESGRQFDPEVVDALIQWILATGRQAGREGDLTAGDLLKAPASAAKV